MVCEFWDSNEIMLDNQMMTPPPHRTPRLTTGRLFANRPTFILEDVGVRFTAPARTLAETLPSLVREEIIGQFHDS